MSFFWLKRASYFMARSRAIETGSNHACPLAGHRVMYGWAVGMGGMSSMRVNRFWRFRRRTSALVSSPFSCRRRTRMANHIFLRSDIHAGVPTASAPAYLLHLHLLNILALLPKPHQEARLHVVLALHLQRAQQEGQLPP